MDRNHVTVKTALMCLRGCKPCRVGVAPLDVRLSVFINRSTQTEECKVRKPAKRTDGPGTRPIQDQKEDRG